MIQVNETAPQFSLPDQHGQTHHLSDYLGKWVLVYFYPEDNTSGCTTQACGLRDNFPKFQGSDAVILGISPDSVESHKQFAEKYNLPFTILADVEKQALQAYGVWQEKEDDGKKYMGVVRTSFLVNPEGKVAKVYEHVNPEVHAQEVLEDLER